MLAKNRPSPDLDAAKDLARELKILGVAPDHCPVPDLAALSQLDTAEHLGVSENPATGSDARPSLNHDKRADLDVFTEFGTWIYEGCGVDRHGSLVLSYHQPAPQTS